MYADVTGPLPLTSQLPASLQTDSNMLPGCRLYGTGRLAAGPTNRP